MAFGPVKKNAIAEEIIARLLGLIRDRQLQPGDKLPPERELAAMLGVSRPSLREALRALSVMNVLEMRQGDGTYVSSLEPDLLVEHLGFVLSIATRPSSSFETHKIVGRHRGAGCGGTLRRGIAAEACVAGRRRASDTESSYKPAKPAQRIAGGPPSDPVHGEPQPAFHRQPQPCQLFPACVSTQ